MPTPTNVIFFETPAQLRAWFEANHETAPELWVGYHRKRTGLASITWQDLVDQELCFGWIDSVRYSLGDERSAQRVTPRRKGSVWSAVNIRRFGELEKMGLVHSSGRAAFDRRDEARSRLYSYENWPKGLDEASETEFRKHRAAWTFFEEQPPSYKRVAAYRVLSAKREETKKRRLEQLIEASGRRERLNQLVSPSRRSPSRAS
ncbi:MAG TPA: YdeI/OmpD-associated family protein [Candidatus Dormibacteraeota bacterium]|nr:YdeI/OmpD-associated family protein [Candidatus Dormibacteraeota bacterium]